MPDTVVLSRKSHFAADSMETGYSLFFYSSTGLLNREISYSAGAAVDSIVYEYDSQGRISLKKTLLPGGALNFEESLFYDVNGRWNCAKVVNGLGELQGTDSLYYSGTRLDSLRHFAADGSFWYSYRCTYQGDQLTEQRFYDANGTADNYVRFEYDFLGRVTVERHYNAAGQPIGNTLSSYDALRRRIQ